jgi:hypothetical protein
MNRRTALFCVLTGVKTALVASYSMASEQAAKAVARIAGPRWNVNGDWTPSLEAIQSHLLTAHGINPIGLGLEEMLALHDNDHNRRGYQHGHGGKQSPKGHSKGYRKA